MNGWCSAVQRPSVSLHSNIGGSTIQSALWRPSGTRSNRLEQLQPDLAERGGGDVGLVGDDQQQVARLAAERLR